MKVDRIDHLVLTVENIDKTVEFYQSVLGMDKVTFEKTGLCSADLCFVLKTSVNDVVEHLNKCDVKAFKGPVNRTGAMGNIVSVYSLHYYKLKPGTVYFLIPLVGGAPSRRSNRGEGAAPTAFFMLKSILSPV